MRHIGHIGHIGLMRLIGLSPYCKKLISTPAATAEPMTPEMLDAMQ